MNILIKLGNELGRAYEFWEGVVRQMYGNLVDVNQNVRSISYDAVDGADAGLNGGEFSEGRREFVSGLFDIVRRQTDDISRLIRENNALGDDNRHYVERQVGDLFRIEELERDIEGLEKNLELQRKGAGFLLAGKKYAEKRFSETRDFLTRIVGRVVELGYNPLTGENGEGYVFVGNWGEIKAMTRTARSIFGERNRGVDYGDVVFGRGDLNFEELSDGLVLEKLHVDVLSANPVMGIEIPDVEVSHVRVGDVYLGSIINLKEIRIVSKIRRILRKRAKKEIRDTARNLMSDISRRLDSLGNGFASGA